MKITKFKKYISWNVISVVGYISMIISMIFFVMFIIAYSGIGIRADIGEYFYTYMINHIIKPYINFYKFQLFIVGLSMVISYYESKYYIHSEQYGLRLFGNHEKAYSILFVTGLAINFLPLYIIYMLTISWLVKFI